MDDLMKCISKYPNGTKINILWNTGLYIEGIINTVYETDNGLEEDEESYKEFYACAVEVVSIITSGSTSDIIIGDLIEISIENCPESIKLDEGDEIWKQP